MNSRMKILTLFSMICGFGALFSACSQSSDSLSSLAYESPVESKSEFEYLSVEAQKTDFAKTMILTKPMSMESLLASGNKEAEKVIIDGQESTLVVGENENEKALNLIFYVPVDNRPNGRYYMGLYTHYPMPEENGVEAKIDKAKQDFVLWCQIQDELRA